MLLQNILFLDIETVSQKATYMELDETFQYLWKHKSRNILKKYTEEITDEEAANTYESAGIYAEFGKICCISVGFLSANADGKWQVRLKSFAGDDEKVILEDFCNLLKKPFSDPNKHFLCGHNLKEFDVPYICRRMLLNGLPLPTMLDISGKKPWETKHLLDTLEMWKFGDGKNYTSLKLLAAIFGFPSPKDDIDGSEVGRVYWQERNVERIAVYCEKDVLAVVQLLMSYQLKPLLTEEQIIFVGR
jgi:DNA polymerase elongation subunit (family B)